VKKGISACKNPQTKRVYTEAFEPIQLSDSDSDFGKNKEEEREHLQARTGGRTRHRSKAKEEALLEVMTKAFQHDSRPDTKAVDEISTFSDHVGQQLRALGDPQKCAIMQNAIENAIFSCKMKFLEKGTPKPDCVSQDKVIQQVQTGKGKVGGKLSSKGNVATNNMVDIDLTNSGQKPTEVQETYIDEGLDNDGQEVKGKNIEGDNINVLDMTTKCTPGKNTGRRKHSSQGSQLKNKTVSTPRVTRKSCRQKSSSQTDEINCSSPGSHGDQASEDT
jgi:hypothetical protein